jgi:ribosome maturation factor RimP
MNLKTRDALWKFIEPSVQAEGLEIFDIDLPSASNRTLRIFLSRPVQPKTEEKTEDDGRQAGVGLEQCARVSQRISRLEGFEESIAEHTVLEVSSPGINRTLRLRKHFQDSVGEHIWLKVYDPVQQKNRVLRGNVLSFQDDQLAVQEDGQQEAQNFSFEDVVSARIDFLFQ